MLSTSTCTAFLPARIEKKNNKKQKSEKVHNKNGSHCHLSSKIVKTSKNKATDEQILRNHSLKNRKQKVPRNMLSCRFVIDDLLPINC